MMLNFFFSFFFFSQLYVFFGEMSVCVFCPFFDCIVCFSGIELHELLGDWVFFGGFICNYFLPFWGLYFCLFMVSFAVQKLLSLIRSHLCFHFHYSRMCVIEDLAVIWQCPACVFLWFIVSDLTFSFLIHFEFIFVYGVRKCSNFHSFLICFEQWSHAEE